MATNTRTKGRRLELKEAYLWRDCGWDIELRHPAKFVGPGRVVAADFFNRYDFIAAWPEGGVVCLVQVSTEGEGSHEEPLGFHRKAPAFTPNALLLAPVTFKDAPKQIADFSGVYELYVYMRHIKGVRGWAADRRWWAR